MKPGINRHVPESDYFALDACSNSRLTDLLDSPAECKFQIDHPSQPTQAMTLGSIVDCLVFTPREFWHRFIVFGQCSATTAKGQRCSKTANRIVSGDLDGDLVQVCGLHADGLDDLNRLRSVSQDDLALCEGMRHAVLQHSTASQIIGECEDFQTSLLWDFQGMPCKARLDGAAWCLDGGTIVDLKKTSPRGSSDSKDSFSRTLYNYGYHRQAAFYRWGAVQCGKMVNNVVFIVVDESKVRSRLKSGSADPKLNECVHVYRIKDESLYWGEAQLQPLLAQYYRCWRSGLWPYDEEIIDVGIPQFAERAIERSLV